jgi:hypothetical protein
MWSPEKSTLSTFTYPLVCDCEFPQLRGQWNGEVSVYCLSFLMRRIL